MFRFVAFCFVLGACQAQDSGVVRMVGEDGKFELVNLTEAARTVSVDESDITVYYFSRATKLGAKTTLSRLEDLEETDFDRNRCSIFLVHGWQGEYSNDYNVKVRKAVLKKRACNVFSVNWSRHAHDLYTIARWAVPKIGTLLGRYIKKVFEDDLQDISLVGFSLGAHIAGFAGKHLNGNIPVIVGLDPAGPLFFKDDRSNRLDSTDAKFVQVIHTNTLALGINKAIGHADYYPNGGVTQKGCVKQVLISTCSHFRSYAYYAESVLTGNFLAVECYNYFFYLAHLCDYKKASYMGTLDVDTRARGKYFLLTAGESPFAMGR